MHREEQWTLARVASDQARQAKTDESKVSGSASASVEPKMGDMPAPSAGNGGGNIPQRRRFVFTDPVAFRFVLTILLV